MFINKSFIGVGKSCYLPHNITIKLPLAMAYQLLLQISGCLRSGITGAFQLDLSTEEIITDGRNLIVTPITGYSERLSANLLLKITNGKKA